MEMASEIVIEVGPEYIEKAGPEEVPRGVLSCIQIQGTCKGRPVGRRQIMQLQKSITERAAEFPENLLPLSH
jgi:hypothetical protein